MFEELKQNQRQISLVKGETFDFQPDDDMLLLELRVEDGFPRKKFEKFYFDSFAKSKCHFKNIRHISSGGSRLGQGSFCQFKVDRYRLVLAIESIEFLINELESYKTKKISDLAFRSSWESATLEEFSEALDDSGVEIVGEFYKYLKAKHSKFIQQQVDMTDFILDMIKFPSVVEIRNTVTFPSQQDTKILAECREKILEKSLNHGVVRKNSDDTSVYELVEQKNLTPEMLHLVM